MNIQSAGGRPAVVTGAEELPRPAVALSEGGTGWIPYFLERVDRTYEMHHAWTLQDFGGRLPSEVFRQHFLTCFISDPVGVAMRDRIGVDNIAWEADYPHSDSMWPEAPEELAQVFADNRRPRRPIGQDDPRERHAVVLLRPLRPRARGKRRRWARCAGRRQAMTSRSWRAAHV